MTLRILERLTRHASERGEAPAVRQVAPACAADAPVGYAALHDAVARVADLLGASVAAGETVVLCSANRPACLVAYLGALAADLTVFPAHPGLTDVELRDAIARSGARACIAEPDRLDAIQGLAATGIDIARARAGGGGAAAPRAASALGRRGHRHAAMLLQSSGTTGRPKIVRRSAAALDAVAANVVEAIGLGPDDRILVALPLCHSYGVEHGILAPILAGAEVRLCDGFDPSTVSRQFAEGGVTVFPGVPFMFQALIDRDVAMRGVRCAYSAGGPLPPRLAAEFEQRAGVPIGQLYGSTEVGSVTFDPPVPGGGDRTSVGRPMRGVRVLILDAGDPDVQAPLPLGSVGHVAIAAPSMLDGYVDDEATPLVDGYFLTGDLGRLDEGGRLHLTGRVKLQIDVGGVKVNPLEVEAALGEHPAVAEAVVVAMPVSDTVTRLRALVVPHDRAAPPDVEALRQHLRARLAAHKIPRVIELCDELPRSPAGKVRREAVG